MGKTRFKYVRRRTLDRTRHSTYFLQWLDDQAARLEITAEDVFQLLLDGMSAIQVDGIPDYGPPVNRVAPEVSGTPEVGSTLTTTDGIWAAFPSATYSVVWQTSADGVEGWDDIEGATDSDYVLDAEDEEGYIRSVVTATNDAGAATESSEAIGPILPEEEEEEDE